MPRPTRPIRRVVAATVLVSAAAAVGCQSMPQSIFGYRLGSAALYDTNIKTIYIPVFTNRAFQSTPYRGMEVDITKAIIDEINTKTPFRVISDPERADTELRGNVVSIGKNILNRTQQNLTRQAEVVITADVLWRDLRTGKNLCAPRRQVNPNGGAPAPTTQAPEPVPFDPDVPLAPPVPIPANEMPIRIVASGRELPELGESTATAEQKAIKLLATQIVSMMEKPW